MSERPRPIEVTDPVTITVDGRQVEVQRGELLIDACERNDAYIPRFCYHPRMEPVGMCRMCLVEVDTGRGPALQPSCMIPTAPDMVVETTSERVTKAQDGVLEFLLANHPLDCPVCDKGGECPLQDQTMAYGPGESRWVEEKRHYEKPIEISPLVLLDRERCILCDRCTRFASEVTDDPLIHFINRGSNTEVNTFPGDPFSSYFSGNTVQICPVGALTATPYRFRARPWDLERTESTCTVCSVGCRVTLESSRDRMLRINGVDADPVNWSWLCDAGRFAFEATNSEDRLTEPLRRGADGSLEPVRWSEALAAVADALGSADPSSVAVLGGSRSTDESAYAWAALAKGVVGTDHVDAQLGDGLPAAVFDLPGATIDEVCRPGGTVLYVGPDPKEELPVLFLRLKHAAQRDRVRIVEVTPTSTSLTPYSAAGVRPRPGELAAVAEALVAGDAPADGVAGVSADDLRAAAAVLGAADGPVTVVLGRANLAESPQVVLDAAAALSALPGVRFLPAVRRGNVRGAVTAGMAPGRLPGGGRLDGDAGWSGVWSTVPTEVGADAMGILAAAADGAISTLVLLGADPLRDAPDRALAERALDRVGTIVAIDSFPTPSVLRADVVLPAAMLGEVDGSTTNLEGRVSRVRPKVTPPGTARADWAVAVELARRLGATWSATSVEALRDELVAGSPRLAGTTWAELEAADDGVLVDLTGGGFDPGTPAPVPQVDSYSLRLVLSRELYDEGELLGRSESMAGLSRTPTVGISVGDAERLGVEDGTPLVVRGERGSSTLPARVSAGIPRGTAHLVHRLEGSDPITLLSADEVACDVRVELA